MAITRAETQVQWSASDSVSVTSGSNQESDEVNLDATCIAAQVSVKADNAGTPAAGDILDIYLLQTSGDPDGSGTDEFDTASHALYLGELDTNAEDPAIATFELPIPQDGLKIRAVSGAASNSITVSATITEQRAA